MFKHLTYQQKNKLLLGGFVLMLLVSYWLAIGKTLSTMTLYKDLEKKSGQIEQSPMNLKLLEKKRLALNQIIENKKDNQGSSVHASLLNIISNFCDEHHILLREYPGTIENIQNDLIVETNMFEVQGTFNKLLELNYMLEQKQKVAKVVSTLFMVKRDLQTRNNILTATIYFQNIKPHENTTTP